MRPAWSPNGVRDEDEDGKAKDEEVKDEEGDVEEPLPEGLGPAEQLRACRGWGRWFGCLGLGGGRRLSGGGGVIVGSVEESGGEPKTGSEAGGDGESDGGEVEDVEESHGGVAGDRGAHGDGEDAEAHDGGEGDLGAVGRGADAAHDAVDELAGDGEETDHDGGDDEVDDVEAGPPAHLDLAEDVGAVPGSVSKAAALGVAPATLAELGDSVVALDGPDVPLGVVKGSEAHGVLLGEVPTSKIKIEEGVVDGVAELDLEVLGVGGEVEDVEVDGDGEREGVQDLHEPVFPDGGERWPVGGASDVDVDGVVLEDWAGDPDSGLGKEDVGAV